VTLPGPVPRRHGEWWIWGTVLLVVSHATIYTTIQSRPGLIAVPLWIYGPPMLVITGVVLLAGSLMSTLRGRQTTLVRAAAFVALIFVLANTVRVYRVFPSEYDDKPSDVVMRLPLDGPITVAWGGPERRVNYHVRSPAERWGFDLLVTVNGASYTGSGESVTDYYAYDRPVFAPADGVVVKVVDGVPDAAPDAAEPSRRGGNIVVLEVAQNQYLFLVHLKSGSLRVAPGDRVRRGDVLAHVGNSGNTSEPHVHMHLQDTPAIARGQGIPFHFGNYLDESTGETIARGMPEGGVRRGRYVGDIVWPLEAVTATEESPGR